jgi:hypothetical protein
VLVISELLVLSLKVVLGYGTCTGENKSENLGYIMSQQVGFDLSKSNLFKKSPDVDLDECRLQYWERELGHHTHGLEENVNFCKNNAVRLMQHYQRTGYFYSNPSKYGKHT